jgi:hypothetical protein
VVGVVGTPDDVTVDAPLPLGLRLLDVWLHVTTAVGGSTAQLRSATGGGGIGLTTALSTAATGLVRNTSSLTPTRAAGQSIFLRRSDRGIAGDVCILCART